MTRALNKIDSFMAKVEKEVENDTAGTATANMLAARHEEAAARLSFEAAEKRFEAACVRVNTDAVPVLAEEFISAAAALATAIQGLVLAEQAEEKEVYGVEQ